MNGRGLDKHHQSPSSLRERVIITREFNARPPLWHDEDFNINGRALDDAYRNLKAVLINSYGPTRVAERSGDADSCINITMASADLVPEISWKLLLLESDHKPALIKLLKPSCQQVREPMDKFKYDVSGVDVISQLRASKTRQKSTSAQTPQTWLDNKFINKPWENKLAASRSYTDAKRQKTGDKNLTRQLNAMKQQPNRYVKKHRITSVSHVTRVTDGFRVNSGNWPNT